jgi:hypothetical protein
VRDRLRGNSLDAERHRHLARRTRGPVPDAPAAARWIVWTAAAAACTIVYFHGYQSPSPPTDWSARGAVAAAADVLLMTLGSPLAAADPMWARALGVMTLAAIVVLWVGVWTFDRRDTHAGLVGLSLIAVAGAAAVGVGRGPRSPAAALQSGVLYSTLGLIAPTSGPRRSRISARAAAGRRTHGDLCVGLIAANLTGLGDAAKWRREREREKYLLQTIEIQPDESVASIFRPPELRQAAAYLRAAHLGPFRDTVDTLMAPRWREATPTEPITAAAPLRAHLVCPVDTLEDVAVVLTRRADAPAAGAVRIVVRSDGADVGHAQIDASAVRGTTRASISRRLCPGAARRICSWGDHRQRRRAGGRARVDLPDLLRRRAPAGAKALDDRSLGIAFNAFSCDLLS